MLLLDGFIALDVYIQPSYEPSLFSRDDYIGSFSEDEGEYWFLYPLFQRLYCHTGQMIDLYDTALFSGEKLDDLLQTLSAAMELVQSQPENWNVPIGKQKEPSGEWATVVVSVNKFRLLTFLERMQEATLNSRERSYVIVFFGD